jgi:hypothetical protein
MEPARALAMFRKPFFGLCSLMIGVLGAACSGGEPDGPVAVAPTEDAGKGPRDPGANNRSSLPEQIQKIEAGLHALIECPDRIWAGDSWTNRQLLFVGNVSEEAFLWNDQSNRGSMHAVSFADLPQSLKGDFLLDVLDYRGAKTLAVSLDLAAVVASPHLYTDFAIIEAIHEGFHVFAQPSWAALVSTPAAEASYQSPAYPDVWQLRYLRAQVLGAMQASLYEDAPLGNVAHWQQRLRSEYASDLKDIGETDVLEGTARYVEARAVVLGKLGCSATDEAVLAEVKGNGSTFIGPTMFEAGLEPYDLGLVALQLLRKRGASGFETAIQAGTAPVDVLLEGVAPIAQTEDPAVVDAAKSTIESRNAAAAKWIEPMLVRLDSPTSVRVALPLAWMGSSYESSDPYRLVNEPGEPQVERMRSVTLEDPVSQIKVKVGGIDTISFVETPCATASVAATHFLVLPLDAGAVTLGASGTRLAASTAGLSVSDLPVQVKTDSAGREWVCPSH